MGEKVVQIEETVETWAQARLEALAAQAGEAASQYYLRAAQERARRPRSEWGRLGVRVRPLRAALAAVAQPLGACPRRGPGGALCRDPPTCAQYLAGSHGLPPAREAGTHRRRAGRRGDRVADLAPWQDRPLPLGERVAWGSREGAVVDTAGRSEGAVGAPLGRLSRGLQESQYPALGQKVRHISRN